MAEPAFTAPETAIEAVRKAMEAAQQKIAELEAENDLLREHATDKISAHTLMTGLSVGNGGIDMGLQGGAAAMLAESFAKQFKEGGGANYLELRFVSKEEMPDEAFVVTLQRCNGLTPTQKLAEAQRDAARYRWLRARRLDDDEIYIAIDSARFPGRWGLGGTDPKGCDATIDLAMLAEQGDPNA